MVAGSGIEGLFNKALKKPEALLKYFFLLILLLIIK